MKVADKAQEQLIEEIERLRQEVHKLRREKAERKQAEKALEESEEKYRTQFEQALDAIFIADTETGILVNCNQAACELVGRKKSELVGQHQRILHPPQEKNGDVTRTFKQHLGEKEGQVVETQVITKKGEMKEVSIKANVIELRGKKLLQGIFHDITERKQAEDLLQKLEEDWRNSFNSLEDVMLLIDRDYNIENINDKGLALLKKSREKVIGRKCYEVISGADSPAEYCPCRQSLKTKKAASLDRYEKRFDRYFSIRTSPIFDENGEITKFVDLRHDITNRKRSEDALQEAKTRFEDLFETANELIITTNTEGWILRLNKEMERFSSYSKKELIGQSILKIAYPEDTDKFIQFWKDILSGLTPHYELRTISKTGNVRHLLASGNAVRKDGNIVEIQYNAKDITEEKQAEEKLRESEKKYRTILESVTEGYYELDLAGNLTFFNDSLCQTLGYTRDEMMGMNNRQYMDEENARKVYQIFNEVYRTSKPRIGAEWESIRKDGTKLSVSSSVSLIRDSQGKPIGFRGLSRDITQQKQAEKELQKNEGKYQTILENVVEGYYEVDLAGNFTLVNDAVCHNLGYSRDELVGMNNRDYMDEQTARKVLERYAEVYTTGIPARGFEFEVIRKDGTKLVTSSSVSLITDEKGQPTSFRGIVRDITEEKQAEEKLRQSEERYRTILESIEHGYFEVDIRGNLTFFNDALCEINGYTRDEMIGMNNRQYMDKENARKVYQTFNKVYTTGKPAQGFDWEVIRKDGTKRTVDASVSLIRNSEGKPTGFRGVVQDITERKEMEAEKEEMERKTQLATRLSTMGEMATGIIHEINNPLTSVIGFAAILADKDLPEDAKEYATIINNEGKRVANIAGRLLNFARRQKPEIVYTDINELIKSTLDLQTYEMETGNIKVTAKFDPHLPRTMADPGQLQQVFLNITLNARTVMRAAHGGGKLLVKTEAIDSTIRISFEDDGPGVPQENLKTIFNPFFTTRKAGEGTGLGLSICRGIISSHKGMIYVESTLGKGATFIIELPVVARQKNKARTARANGNNVWR